MSISLQMRTEKEMYRSNFAYGASKSCGCYSHVNRTLPPGVAGFNALFARYAHQAGKRGFTFELSEDDFKSIISKNCHYCGLEPSRLSTGRTAASKLLYNGVDRMDPTLGYHINNCVACCFTCNRSKNTMPYQAFTAWLKRVSQHWK